MSNNIWFYFILLMLPILASSRNIIVKYIGKKSNNSVNAITKTIGFYGFSIPWTYILLVLPQGGFQGIPSDIALYCIIGSGLSIAIGYVCVNEAISEDDISKVSSFQNLSPIIVVPVGYVFFNLLFPTFTIQEKLGIFPLIGGSIFIAGFIYIVKKSNINFKRGGDFKYIGLMVLSSFVLSGYAIGSRLGVHHISKPEFVFWTAVAATFSLCFYALFVKKAVLKEIIPNIKWLMPLGLITSVILFFEAEAAALVSLTAIPIVVKRGSTFIDTVAGYYIFGEGKTDIDGGQSKFRVRLFGALILLCGGIVAMLGPLF